MASAASMLDQDPDKRVVRWGWLLWATWAVIAGALFLDDVRGGTGALSLILVAPFWAIWLLWPVYRGLRAWWRWQHDSAWGDWNGTYYEFDGRQIRVLMQGDSIWIVADDVFDALQLRGRQRDAARVREIAGRDGLVKPPGSTRLAFSEIGIRAWLDRRSDVVAHKFAYWLDKQVIAPYRKRREFQGSAPLDSA
jgi:hypothetical protein